MRRLAGPAVGLALVCLTGCGGSSARERVDAYIAQANAVQARAAPALRRADAAYVAFSNGRQPAAPALRDVIRAEDALRTTRARLAALAPPPAARTLHRRLLAAFDANLELAAETTALARYVPRLDRALRPLGPAGDRLRRELPAAPDPAAQSRTVDRYVRRLDGLVGGLRRLSPPPILRTALHRQEQRLERARSLARRLSTAIRRGDSAGVAALLTRFRTLNASRAGRSTIDAASLRAYAARLRAAGAAAAAAQRERARLDSTLG